MTEILSLSLCEQMLLPLAGTPFGDGLRTVMKKIRSLLPETSLAHFRGLEKKLIVKNVPSYDYSRHSKEIGIFNQAITESRALKIRYRSTTQPKPYDTCFHPYGLVVYSGDLYCIGFMEKYCEIRTLKLSRVLGVELLAKPFHTPKDFKLENYLDGSFGIIAWGEPKPITVRLYSWAATAIREHQWHPSQKIVEDGKDSVTVQFELSDTTEFKRWVLGFGRNARVLKPAELVQDIAQELAEAQAVYKADA
jgi:predicted DNA-binding transcriptional regulator YafY